MDLPDYILSVSKEAMEELLPDKSSIRYTRCYNKFLDWQKSKNISSFDEKVLLTYFYEISQTFAPPTLWSIYSMLKKTISCYHNMNIALYAALIAFIKVFFAYGICIIISHSSVLFSFICYVYKQFYSQKNYSRVLNINKFK
jgi:hypothetical protein